MPYDEKEVANRDLLIPLIPMANCIGTYVDEHYNDSWHLNDGVVNTISQDGPINATIIHYHNQSSKIKTAPGVWNHCGEFKGFDHGDVLYINAIMNPFDRHDMGNFYYRLAGSLFGIGEPGNEYCPQL